MRRPGAEFKAAFSEFSRGSEDEEVDFQAFKRCMKEKILVGQKVTTKELRILFECFDLNGDGLVGGADLAQLLSNWS